MDQRLHQIAEKLGRDEMLLQLAEECSELSQACLKMVRANKGLTPKTFDECKDSLAEELNDVKVCMELVESLVPGLQSKQEFYREYKTDRWHKRTFLGQDKA